MQNHWLCSVSTIESVSAAIKCVQQGTSKLSPPRVVLVSAVSLVDSVRRPKTDHFQTDHLMLDGCKARSMVTMAACACRRGSGRAYRSPEAVVARCWATMINGCLQRHEITWSTSFSTCLIAYRLALLIVVSDRGLFIK